MFSSIKSAFTTESPPTVKLPNGVTEYKFQVTKEVYDKYMSVKDYDINSRVRYITDAGLKSIESAFNKVGFSTSVANNKVYPYANLRIYSSKDQSDKNQVAEIDHSSTFNTSIPPPENETPTIILKPYFRQKYYTLNSGVSGIRSLPNRDLQEKDYGLVYSVISSWAKGIVGGKKRRSKTYKKKSTSRKTRRSTR